MHYFITGHTGFKGAWLALWLVEQGHTVSGMSLDPAPGSLFETADLASLMTGDTRADIRDPAKVAAAIQSAAPDVVIHMAAQPLVRESYRDPRWTVETNVMGTLNVLEAVRATDSVRAQLIITTDKVYRNVNQVAGYVETDPLGGDDPYSASKAMADLLTQSWITSFGGPPTAVARAGNVIGGGDVSQDRLIPDIIHALESGKAPELRYPSAVRPWQHVLDCLNGYLLLVDRLLVGPTSPSNKGAWNFGPDESSFVTVGDVANLVATRWGSTLQWVSAGGVNLHEASLLALDSTNSANLLNWRSLLCFQESVEWTVDWYRAVGNGKSARDCTVEQVHAFDQRRR
jgi:CDP-glucose 4,6-dehydratase